MIRMLKGAVMPKSWSYSISFGDHWKEQRLDVDDFSFRHSETRLSEALVHTPGAVNSSFVQAPRRIPWLHHFGQQSVYFLVETTGARLPEYVIITASSQHGGTKTATLPVTQTSSSHTTIRHLAAKAAVRDLEAQDASEAPSSIKIRENAERLCQMYSISSKWTSFVAVSRLQPSAEYEDIEVSLYRAPLAELDLLTRPGVSQAGANLVSQAGLQSIAEPHPRRGEMESLMPRRMGAQLVCRSLSPQPSSYGLSGSFNSNPYLFKRDSLASPGSEILDEGIGESPMDDLLRKLREATRPEHLAGCRDRRRRARAKKRVSETDLSIGSQSSHTPAVYDLGCTSPDGLDDDARVIDWQEVIRCQRADGLFNLEKGLGDRMAQHFCHGTRLALKGLLMKRVETPVADDAEESGDVRLLVDTVMALAYIRSHFYSQRGLWDLLVQKAEGRLASHLSSGEWAEPEGLSAMADSALAHAHYGRCSQGSAESVAWIHNADSVRCGVCIPHNKEWPSSVMHDDEFGKCSVPGCDVSVGKWNEFWVHAVEQGHIYSTCEASRSRYSEATAKVKGGNVSGEVQRAQREVVQEDPGDQHRRNRSELEALRRSKRRRRQ